MQRQPLGRDDERNHDLHAVEAMVAAVTEPPHIVLIERRIGLEVGTRQVIQQHLEADVEQIAPATHQMLKQHLLVLKQAPMTAVENVRISQ